MKGTRMRRIICILMIIGLLSMVIVNPCVSQNNQVPGNRPYITSTVPQDGALDVKVDTELVIVFSKPMNTSSVEYAFQIFPAELGTFSWELNNTKLIFTPDEYFAAGDCGPQEYTVTILKFASDLNQTKLESEFSFSFTTVLMSGMGKISGIVTEINGNLFEGAEVSIEGYSPVKTKANGYYEFKLPNGDSYNVTVEAKGYYPITKNSGAICVGSNVSLNFALVPIEDETTEDGEQFETINVCFYMGFILVIQIIIILIIYFSKKGKNKI